MADFCRRFWGPFGLVRGREAGGSAWVPAAALALARLAAGAALLAVAISDERDQPRLQYSAAFSASVVLGAGFLLLAACSALLAGGGPGAVPPAIATVAAALFQAGAGLALYALAALAARAAYPLRNIESRTTRFLLAAFLVGRGRAADALPAALALADFALGSRLRFRLPLLPLPVLVLAAQMAAHVEHLKSRLRRLHRLAYVLYHFPAFFRRGRAAFAQLITAQIAICFACSLAAFLLSRLPILCVPEDEEDDDSLDGKPAGRRLDIEETGRETILFESAPPYLKSPGSMHF